jgi:hypothetical protein
MDLKEVGYGVVDWVHLTQVTVHYQTLLNIVVILHVT